MKYLILFLVMSLGILNQSEAQEEQLPAVSSPIKEQQDMNSVFSERQQKICTIAVNTAMGNLDLLKSELRAGLEAGLTINEINEVLIQLYAYCGFPRSLQGINTFMALINERKEQGIADLQGEEPVRVTGENKYQQGKEMLERLTHVHESTPAGANAFAPGIDIFLKEHLFADIFGRGVLSYAERELVTVSCLTALGNVDPMLQSHFNISLNVGVSGNQLKELIRIVKPFIGNEKAENAHLILARCIEFRNNL